MSHQPIKSDLLPPSATTGERALSEAASLRLESVNLNFRQLWNPDTCPEALLVYLAWALSVDTWQDSWPEHIKRQVIKDSLYQHRIKGSRQSVADAISAFNAQAVLREWWETSPQGTPHTFEVWLNTPQSQQFMPVLSVGSRETVSQTEPYDIVPTRVYQLVMQVRVNAGSEGVKAGFNGHAILNETVDAADNWKTLAQEITGADFQGLTTIIPFFEVANAKVQRLALWDLFENEQVILNHDFSDAGDPLRHWSTLSPIETVSFGLTASIQDQVVAAINRVKPVRSHFTANTAIAAQSDINFAGAIRMINHRRLELTA